MVTKEPAPTPPKPRTPAPADGGPDGRGDPGAETQPALAPPKTGRIKELEKVLERFHGQRLVLFLKGYPDPDSIGSALAHHFICAGLGVDADIVHFEELSHHENKALVKRLEIDLIRWSPDMDLGRYAGCCFVDTQTPELPIEIPDGLEVVSLVDHHKILGPIEAEFVDVREDAGSTASIYAEYLAEGKTQLDAGSFDCLRLATALMHGIRSDTDDYLTARGIDFSASSFLSPYVDRDLLAVVSHQSISAKSMDILQVALDQKIIKGTYLIAGVRHVRDEDRDGIGEAADYLVRREGVDTVLVYGIVGGQIIDGSFRTRSNTVDPDKWMKDMFGIDRSGRYYGGGRREKGGFQMPLGIFGSVSDRELLWQLVKHTVEDLFFEKIGATREER